jgi:hypothetical protein
MPTPNTDRKPAGTGAGKGRRARGNAEDD